MQGLPARRRRVLEWARRTTLARHEKRLRGEPVPALQELAYRAAQQLVLNKLKIRLGLDRGWLFTTSAAPIAEDVLRFFASIDILLRELYGQSELTGPVTLNTPANTRFGSLGRPVAGIQVRLAEDGEILVKSPGACLGYYRDPEATARLMDGGWLRTGDVGALDNSGYLRLTGRKKELITTANGEKIAPGPLEESLRTVEPIAHAVVIGQGRPYLAALLTLDRARLQNYARAHQLPSDPELLTRSPEFLRRLEHAIFERVNATLGEYQRVQRFCVLPGEFTVAGAELTPTLKVRREVVETKYRDRFDALYDSSSSTVPRPARTAATAAVPSLPLDHRA